MKPSRLLTTETELGCATVSEHIPGLAAEPGCESCEKLDAHSSADLCGHLAANEGR